MSVEELKIKDKDKMAFQQNKNIEINKCDKCQSSNDVERKILKVALIGVGNMGKKYAEMITAGEVSDMKLTAVVIRRDELMAWGESLVNVDNDKAKIFRNADDLFKESELYDAVIIATPHKTHMELALKAFAFHKDVLCDKPAAADLEEALQMNKSAKENDCIYGMVFHQRLYPKYIKIKELIDKGELGDIKRICLINSRYLRTAHYHKSGSWRSSFKGEGGGALINQGQHILDMFQYLFGMPQSLFATIPFGKYNDFAVDDEATIIMRYDNGTTGTFIISTGEACHEEKLEIIGTKARILLTDNTLLITRHEDVNNYIKTQNVNSRENMHFTEEKIKFEKTEEPYVELLEKFAKASLEHDEKYLVAKGEEGINSLMMCAASYYSAINGAKVKLPLNAAAYRELMEELIRKEEQK